MEIIEESYYSGGKLIWRTVNGLKMLIPPDIIQNSDVVIIRQMMTKDEAKKIQSMYAKGDKKRKKDEQNKKIIQQKYGYN